MPIYEYYCSDCREVFEKLVRSTEPGPPPCPECGGNRVSKMLSTFAAFSASAGETRPLSGGCACGPGGCGCH